MTSEEIESMYNASVQSAQASARVTIHLVIELIKEEIIYYQDYVDSTKHLNTLTIQRREWQAKIDVLKKLQQKLEKVT